MHCSLNTVSRRSGHNHRRKTPASLAFCALDAGDSYDLRRFCVSADSDGALRICRLTNDHFFSYMGYTGIIRGKEVFDMIGALLGDMIGAPYEFDRGAKTKDFPLFSKHSEFTDDSVMTIAVAEALLDTLGQPDEDITATLILK
jgi:hypothetical protein